MSIGSESTFDAVIVGSGGAGLATALSAALSGGEVVVLERARVLGGTTAISGAGMWLPLNTLAAEMGYEDSPEEVRTYLRRLAVGRTTDELIDAFVEAAPRAFAMLAETARVEFAATTHPDYQTGLPGAKAGGRSIWPTLYDGKRLGELLPLIRDTPHPGGMPPVTYKELEDSNWGLGQNGGAWAELAAKRREEQVFGKGRALIGALVEACAEHGVRFEVNARAVELIERDGKVAGVLVETPNGTTAFNARRGVVLASGGFEWNAKMWTGLIGTPLDGPLSPPGNDGDALRMSMKVGARLGNTSEVWWMPGIAVTGETYDGQRRLRMGAAGKSLPGAIVVNKTGRRFANESMNYNDFGKYMVHFDPSTYEFPNHPAFVAFDADHHAKYPPIAYDADKHHGEEWLVEAPTLRELAEKLGIDPDGFEAQVAEFNADAELGEDKAFARGALAYDRSGKFGDRSLANPNLAPLKTAPFYGYRLEVACLGTKGGPVINARAEVVNHDDHPIPGLYAAGNAAAAVFGTAYPGGGATIGAGVTFGYLAGRALMGVDERAGEAQAVAR